MKRTVEALMCRSVPSDLAASLAENGLTVKRLKQTNHRELKQLGLSQDSIDALTKGGRPSIDKKTLHDLLYECRWTCCRCRLPRTPVVVHHIRPWAKSKSHAKSNLVVLCNNCHSDAHTKRELDQNLGADALRHHKQEWLEFVLREDTENLFRSSLKDGIWDYFNHQRLIEISRQFDIDCTACAEYFNLQSTGVIENVGDLVWSDQSYSRRETSRYLYDGVMRLSTPLYEFHSDLLRSVVASSQWIDLRRIWTRTEIEALVTPGRLISLTAYMTYTRDGNKSAGPGQMRTGRYRKNGVELRFTVDAWEATSSSAIDHLSARWVATCVCIVRSLHKTTDTLTIEATCLGIGTGFTDYMGETPNIALIKEREDEEEWEDDGSAF